MVCSTPTTVHVIVYNSYKHVQEWFHAGFRESVIILMDLSWSGGQKAIGFYIYV